MHLLSGSIHPYLYTNEFQSPKIYTGKTISQQPFTLFKIITQQRSVAARRGYSIFYHLCITTHYFYTGPAFWPAHFSKIYRQRAVGKPKQKFRGAGSATGKRSYIKHKRF